MTDTMRNYYLAWISTEAYYESSADSLDYWGYDADKRFEGYALMKREHPYQTVTGKVIRAPRLLKRNPTLADLRRLRYAAEAAMDEHWAEHRARAEGQNE